MNSQLRRRLSKLYGTTPAGEASDLRRRLQKIHRPRATPPLEEFLGGTWVERAEGRTLVVDRDYEFDYQHGNISLNSALKLTGSELDVLATNADFEDFSPFETLFLDTETTGLSGGTGTCAFLVGVGYFESSHFRIRQFFLPGYQHERAFLQFLGELVEATSARFMVTFNGKCYDLNLLGYRYVLQKVEHSFLSLQHLDLLHPSRVLWRDCFANCSLQTLELHLLEYGRRGDIPSAHIPRLYFNYLHTGACASFDRVLEHNRLDILSMVGLLVRAAELCRHPDDRFFVSPLRASRLHQLRGNWAMAERLLEESLNRENAPCPKVLGELGLLKKRLDKRNQALQFFEQSIRLQKRPPVALLVEAAKILEHHLHDFAAALELVTQALEFESSPALEHREYRLRQKLAGERWHAANKKEGSQLSASGE